MGPQLFAIAAAAMLSGALTAQDTNSFRGRPSEAHAVAVTGQVSRIRDAEPWALSGGEQVPVQQVITSGPDGYARFEVAGGSSFEIFSNSRVIFRQNAAVAGDLLDVLDGRVRVHLQPVLGEAQQRIYTPLAVISTHEPTTLAVAVAGEEVRVDVIEGEIHVQHKLLPRNEPVLVKSVDAIVIRPDQPISRQVERGSLFRYTVKSLRDIWSAVTPGHPSGHNLEVLDENRILAESSARPPHATVRW